MSNLYSSESMTRDNLFAGTQVMPVVADSVTIVSGEGSVARGTVLGVITASGKYAVVDSTAQDGSNVPMAVVAQAVDATSADAVATVYLTGEFNESALIFGGTDTAATHRVNARKVGMFFKKVIA